MEPLFDARAVTARLNDAVARWHETPISHDEQDTFLKLALTNQGFNFQLWHEEDKARDPHAAPEDIAACKHAIDGFNQQRNDSMERMDEFVLEGLRRGGVNANQQAPLHSETVGSIVDRLAILALKSFHMREETLREDAGAAHRRGCADKLAVLEAQQQDLAGCLAMLHDELCQGRIRFKVYRQMKMYNDPSLNPVLYGKGKPGGS
ncbi:MAG: DUF4254 domain-containing protein [SAR324 cluster bacterium]|nr:DUF4254 domain-containing protein [SAR324 cluster bacterium]